MAGRIGGRRSAALAVWARPARSAGAESGSRRGIGGLRAGADLLGLARGRRLRRGGGRLVETLLDQRVGLALDLFLGLLARFFLGQPLLVLVVGLLARLVLDGASGGILGGALARGLGVAVGVDQGPRAGFLFLFGQGAQHDAAAGARRTRRSAGAAAPSWPERRRPASGCARSVPPAGASAVGGRRAVPPQAWLRRRGGA